ncbi:MAG: hypothetical protein ACYCYO_17340 [Bacilli bacterium]
MLLRSTNYREENSPAAIFRDIHATFTHRFATSKEAKNHENNETW